MDKKTTCCRVCLRKCRKSIELNSLFREEQPQLNFFCVFNICTGLGAIHDDSLPQILCSACGNDLLTSFNFLQQAQDTDRKLRKVVDAARHFSDHAPNINSTITASPKYKVIPATNTSENGVAFMDICGWAKDPLEDTDNDEAYDKIDDNILCYGEKRSLREYNNEGDEIEKGFEEDDNKPLTELFRNTNDQKELNVQKSIDLDLHCAQSIEQFNKPCDDSKDEVLRSNSDDVADFVMSPQSQIFPQGRYKCETCRKQYFTSVGLKAHHAVHIPENEKIKRKSRVLKKRIPKGASVVDKNSKNSLPNTEKVTRNDVTLLEQDKTILKNIARKRKPPKPKKMFPCHVCGKHMISASKLRYHMVMHTGEKDYLCTMCPKAYSTIYALKHHMRTHTGERPYECKFCGNKFTRPTTLKSHMRRHTGERPYGCDICGKRFIQHSSMTTHMKLNHMAKTIPCPHCDKKYARQTDLSTHMLSHTGDKPFSCQLCPSRFIRQANLNKHMNQQHNPLPNESNSLALVVSK